MTKTVIGIVFCFFSIPSLACSCIDWDFEDRIKKAHSIYVGVVRKAEHVTPKNEKEWDYIQAEISVVNTLKGNEKDKIKIKTGLGGGDCGVPMEIAQTYLIFKQESVDFIGICGGSGVIHRAKEAEIADRVKEIVKKTSNK